MFGFGTITLALALVAVDASPLNSNSDSRTAKIELHQAPGQINAHAASLRAYARRQGLSGAAGTATAGETADAGFWFGNFTVGAASGLSLLIDTGSADVAVNPGKYRRSSSGRSQGYGGTLEYLTTEENGCGQAIIQYRTWQDVVSLAGLASTQQIFGNITPTPPPDSGTTTQFPHDGLVGFLGSSPEDTQIGGEPFFQSLCNEGAVAACQFGLAYGTSGKGEQILGTVDPTLYSGSLTTVEIESQWQAESSGVTVAGKTFLSNRNLVFDSGTANVIGPQSDVKALFKNLGIQAVPQNLPGCTQAIFGYYKCNAPPTVGFTFGDGKVYNIEPSAFQLANNGNNNCTSIIVGMDWEGSGTTDWLVGQAWFQGKYVDHNVDAGTMGFATLKNKSG